jgi:hypothetical protein
LTNTQIANAACGNEKYSDIWPIALYLSKCGTDEAVIKSNPHEATNDFLSDDLLFIFVMRV